MPDLPISLLPAGAAVGAADPFPSVQAGVTVQVTTQQLYNAITVLAAGGALGTADQFAASQAGVAVRVTTQQLYNAIDALGAAGAIASTDNLAVTQAGVALKAPASALLTYVLGAASFSEAVQDLVAAMCVAGTNMTITYDDALGTLTFDASGGGAAVPRIFPAAGKWMGSTPSGVIAAGTAATADLFVFIPYVPGETYTVSQLGLRITSTSAGGSIQFGIHAADANGKPTGNPLATTASVSTTTTGNVAGTLSSNVQLVSGSLYWIGMVCNNSVAAFQTTAVTNPYMGYVYGGLSQAEISQAQASVGVNLNYAGTFGTWPDLTAQAFTNSNTNRAYYIQLLVASVP